MWKRKRIKQRTCNLFVCFLLILKFGLIKLIFLLMASISFLRELTDLELDVNITIRINRQESPGGKGETPNPWGLGPHKSIPKAGVQWWSEGPYSDHVCVRALCHYCPNWIWICCQRHPVPFCSSPVSSCMTLLQTQAMAVNVNTHNWCQKINYPSAKCLEIAEIGSFNNGCNLSPDNRQQILGSGLLVFCHGRPELCHHVYVASLIHWTPTLITILSNGLGARKFIDMTIQLLSFQ